MENLQSIQLRKTANEETVMATITTSFPNLFSNVIKNVQYLNHLLAKQTQSQFYLETIQNGVIYVFKNIETMKILNTPLRKVQLKQLLKSDYQGSQFFMEKILCEDTFPSTPIILRYEIDAPCKDIALETLYAYFRSYNCDDIIAEKQPDESLLVHFKTFAGLQLYTERLGRLLRSLMTIKNE